MIIKQKAHDVLVRAIDHANTRSDSKRIGLIIAGGGPLRTEIETLARSLGIDNKIHFTELVDRDRIYHIFSEIDIYTMPSRWEVFSNITIERPRTETPCTVG